MNVGDIVRVARLGEHRDRFAMVTSVDAATGGVWIEFEDDHKMLEFSAHDLVFVRRGPFRGSRG